MDKRSLNNLRPGHFEIPLLVALSAGALVAGLILPVITLEELVFWKHTFSVSTGILSLADEGQMGLAVIIFIFSIAFPLTKLTTLLVIWYLKMSERSRAFLLKALEHLGKWSMLDVFVVAITIVITKVSHFAKARPEPGIYVFAVSIFLSMLTTLYVGWLAKRRVPSATPIK